MAQYKGSLRGNRGEVSRLGSKDSGLRARIGGWNLGVETYVKWSETDQCDIVSIHLTGGSKGFVADRYLGTYVRDGNGYKEI